MVGGGSGSGRALVLAALLAVGSAAPAHADGGPCSENSPRVGDLGIAGLDCNCTVSASGAVHAPRWRFRAEPVVRLIEPNGAAAGRLLNGDVIVAVNGALITTTEGALRFSDLEPGVPVTIAVRRDGRPHEIRLVPSANCPEAMMARGTPRAMAGDMSWTPAVAPVPPQPPTVPDVPALTATPAAPAAPSAPATPRPPRAPRAPRAPVMAGGLFTPMPVPTLEGALPDGWLGIGLSCRQCGSQREPGDTHPVWDFSGAPEIWNVEPGSPAAKAGIRRGDVLTHIDGVSLTTADGGRRFGAVRSGQSVRFTLRRGGASQNVTLTVGTHPDRQEIVSLRDQARALQQITRIENQDVANQRDLERQVNRMVRELDQLSRGAADAQRLRYAGAVGGSEVEVRGASGVVVDDTGGELVIVTRDAVIRIRPSNATPRPAARAKVAEASGK
jgi:membrane-associated protease RseP (regulator of RpoE activity)